MNNEEIIELLDVMVNNYERAICEAYNEDDVYGSMSDIFRGRAQGVYEGLRIRLGGEKVDWAIKAEDKNGNRS